MTHMAAINLAWSVLSDPARRAEYDASLSDTNEPVAPFHAHAPAQANPIVQRPRFPWRFMLIIATLGVVFVVVNAALTDPPTPVPLDNILGVGSCVTFDVNGDAAEAACNGPSDGIVDSFVEPDGVCKQGTEMHRDRQGLGQVCVVVANSG